MKQLRILLPLIAALALLAAGCGNDDAGPVGASDLTGSDDYTAFDFSSEYGGLTVTDEPVAFDDPELAKLLAEEEAEEVPDPWAADPELARLEELARTAETLPDSLRPRFTFVHLRWGMLRGEGDTLAVEPPCDVTDWTGSLRTDRGLVVVRRVLGFERPFDHVIFPRLDPRTVALVSHTACRDDGILIQIAERPEAAEDPDAEPNRLHVDLGPYQAVFDVAALRDLHELTAVDELNSVAVTGFTLHDVEVCPKGFLSGVWRRLPADAAQPDSLPGELLGHYTGLWRGLDGRVLGFLRGGYGRDADGAEIFLGKIIGRGGEFRGLVRGEWTPAPDGESLAGFLGRWAGREGRVEGVLGGEAHPVEGTSGGFFVGRWAADCDPAAEELVP
jgi:hypothetical protein